MLVFGDCRIVLISDSEIATFYHAGLRCVRKYHGDVVNFCEMRFSLRAPSHE